ncbi:alpha-xylosidase [Kineosporia succinea]|uniref:Alpha-D-xyloside xylohydrolase n=1 Tax=Kineosporia succinea TaxID=84632 RepID=A0ABT9NVC7_9ACTN|nr:alpha-xylosidase [Kineosporia succinea]MDP9824381.1 alpha-D-xyloside xylohydrolase [Kineosporia succinea]
MKFTDGFWRIRDGVEALYAREVYDLESTATQLVITGATRVVNHRGDTLNAPTLTVTLDSPAEDVVRVRVEHHRGARPPQRFDLDETAKGTAEIDGDHGVLRSGTLEARVTRGTPWNLTFAQNGKILTRSGHRSLGLMRHEGRTYVHEQLELGVGETIYGLGERFGPLVKNGQSVDIWNEDGGTSSEQAYKNVPFFVSSGGYGVLVNDAGRVSFEIGSESVERTQFSVPGEVLEYLVIGGPTPKDVLDRYTALTGRPAQVPAWSYGTWLSTSFTTDYREETVNHFVDGMKDRGIPLSVFHFDCFWMREFSWTDFTWDPRVFPDPVGMLSRLREKDVRVCVWINPYIAQRAGIFDEADEKGYLLKKKDGTTFQWDLWQAGMGLVDFTNPDAVAWYQGHLRRLLSEGVDAFKTDFGERVPTDVVYHNGADPESMHNFYTQLYNRAVFEVLEEVRGRGEAVVFARSATTGGQQFPVHWGGDSTASYVSMAETLRGGLSIGLSGFGLWSHDIGGFEGTPDVTLFKRWTAFGMLSSHSRFHGSGSYRVPWLVDDDDATDLGAAAVARRFGKLKARLAPYLLRAGREAHDRGTPVMRPMLLEFPGDPAVAYLDRQYLLGPDLLVAPVFTPDGTVDYYLPEGRWVSLLTGEGVEGGRWVQERHEVDSLPLLVRPGGVIPLGARDDRPDTEHLDGLTLLVNPGADDGWERTVDILDPRGDLATFTVRTENGRVTAHSDVRDGWGLARPGGERVAAQDGTAVVD